MSTAGPGHPLHHPRYPRSGGYDAAWVVENQMGPNALWLLESLLEVVAIGPGMRVLDLGCGRAMTSIFLARETGARVWATDLWIDASDNQARIEAAGVADLVTPIHAEAHTLPFAHGAFDVVISIDAYQYFSTDDLYLGYLAPFLCPGGRLGMVVPGLRHELDGDPPEPLRPWWQWEFCCFHSPDWWRRHWAKTGLVTVVHADLVEDGWRDWLRFAELSTPTLEGWRQEAAESEMAMLRVDQGRTLGLTRIAATRPAA